ncbi:MAG: amino acid permease [Nitrososphaerota archaeon]
MSNRKTSFETRVFVREATGLVREFGVIEHFMANLSGVVPLFAPAFTAWFIWYAVPGGSVTLASIAAFLFGVFGYLTAFAFICATFPRSGSPYVSQSRILHPSIAWPAEIMLWLSILSFAALIPSAYVIQWGLAPGLFVLGRMLGNEALMAVASWTTTPTGIIVIGTIFLLISLIPAIMGVRVLLRTFLAPLFALGIIGLLVSIGVLLSSNTSQFIESLTIYEPNLRFEELVTIGKELKPDAFVPVTLSIGTFLAALGMTIGTTNSYWNAWSVGEMRRANSVVRQVVSMVIPGFILMLSVVIIIELLQGIAGRDPLIALTLIGTLSPERLSTPLFGGGVVTISIPYILANNPITVILIMIAIIAAAFTFMPINWLIPTRLLFAWSFDRLIPARFASVNERFHTPVFSLIVVFLIVEAWLILVATTPYLGLVFTVTWVWSAVSVGLTCLACALLPLRKEFWEQSPVRKYKILGIPVATIVGLVGFFYQMNGVYQYAAIPELGFGAPQAYLLGASYAVAFALYWIVRAVRARQGIPIDLAFKTLPPE